MNNHQILFLLLLFTFECCTSNIVDSYVKLIQTEQERSSTFVLPTDAQAAKPYSNDYIEYGTFDNIVVGAGSAGAIVASRLSEDPQRDVLLLEAGGYETNFTEIPAMAGYLINSQFNWNFHAVPQTTACLGMNEKRCVYPRGKVVSGSSGINGLLYTRGNKKDFDIWCGQGNPGWCYDDVLPFFKKSENSEIDGDSSYHGFGGYLNVAYTHPKTEKHLAFAEAHRELNRPFVDYNGIRQEGVGWTQVTTKNGRRASTGRMFLKPASSRKNLKILTHSHVTRVLINPKSKKAYGILFAKDNKYYVARSREDIIVSAGTIGSAQLLMLSGIGPKIHLESLGIPVIQNLAVGSNFQDHVGFGAIHFVTDVLNFEKTFEGNVKDYLNGVGDFTDPFDSKVISFIQTNLTTIDDFPDIEAVQILSDSDFRTYKGLFNYDNITYQNSWTNFDTNRSITIFLSLLRPESRGYIKLKSADPFDYPIIDPKLLSDPNSIDIETMYQGILLTLQLLETKAFKRLGTQLHRVHLPACQNHNYLSKEYWYCHLRQLGSSFAHIVGTCKMGPNPSKGAVVDHKLKVHGIENLRVADASIMPTVPSGHTNAASMMVGEKAAHMIMFEDDDDDYDHQIYYPHHHHHHHHHHNHHSY